MNPSQRLLKRLKSVERSLFEGAKQSALVAQNTFENKDK
jgi:hypothetical protein